jgi:hypothetical protein
LLPTQYRDSNNTKGNDRKTEKNRETSFPTAKNEEPEGNEENRYSDPDSNEMKINYAK